MTTSNINDSNCLRSDHDHDETFLGEELGFFDFFEEMADEIDTITDGNDFTFQRRRLKDALEQRINIWSNNLKQPNFIRTRDKIAFSIGVGNACCSPLIASRWPHLFPFVYTIQAIYFIPLRFFSYKRKKWHYSVFDLCYFVNCLTLLYLWVFPSSTMLFTVCYMLSHGPLICSIVLWRNSLVFHSLDKITNVFIHIYPALTLFTIRWLLPGSVQRELYPAVVALGSSLPIMSAMSSTVIFYFIWQSLYFIFIVYGRREKVANGLRATSYTWLLSDKNGFVSRLIGIIIKDNPKKSTNQWKILMYFILQFSYMFITVLPACLCYYSYIYINITFLWLIFAVSIYNGASFYIEIFSRRYIKSLELLRDFDNTKVNGNATDQSEDMTFIEQKKDS